MTSSRDSHTSQSREVPAAITEAIGLLEIHGYDSAAENLRDWSNGHFRPVQSQGEVITPEPGQAYVDALGDRGLCLDKYGLFAVMKGQRFYTQTTSFTPISKLVPESQPRGSVVTEAEYENARTQAQALAADSSWTFSELCDHYIKPLIIGAPTPSVAAGTESDDVRDWVAPPLSRKSKAASTDDFDIRVEMLLTALRARYGWGDIVLGPIEKAINEFLRPMVGSIKDFHEMKAENDEVRAQRDAALSAKQEAEKELRQVQDDCSAWKAAGERANQDTIRARERIQTLEKERDEAKSRSSGADEMTVCATRQMRTIGRLQQQIEANRALHREMLSTTVAAFCTMNKQAQNTIDKLKDEARERQWAIELRTKESR